MSRSNPGPACSISSLLDRVSVAGVSWMKLLRASEAEVYRPSLDARLRIRLVSRTGFQTQRQGCCSNRRVFDGNERVVQTEPLLTIERRRQAVATERNGFRLISPCRQGPHLPTIATGCDRRAP
jgi:hypothetical protein